MYGAKLMEEPADKSPGTILDIDDQGIHVAVSGGKLVATKVRPAKGGKVAAAEFATEHGLKTGDVFDT
jgi:methionyl-tRNA formyltransferase